MRDALLAIGALIVFCAWSLVVLYAGFGFIKY